MNVGCSGGLQMIAFPKPSQRTSLICGDEANPARQINTFAGQFQSESLEHESQHFFFLSEVVTEWSLIRTCCWKWLPTGADFCKSGVCRDLSFEATKHSIVWVGLIMYKVGWTAGFLLRMKRVMLHYVRECSLTACSQSAAATCWWSGGNSSRNLKWAVYTHFYVALSPFISSVLLFSFMCSREFSLREDPPIHPCHVQIQAVLWHHAEGSLPHCWREGSY